MRAFSQSLFRTSGEQKNQPADSPSLNFPRKIQQGFAALVQRPEVDGHTLTARNTTEIFDPCAFPKA